MITTQERSGAKVLVDQLRVHGTDTVFCVPGESYLAVLDALYDAKTIKVVSCRHEGGAAMMAEAQGKLTGKPSICMVTRGPGATNASAGLHIAMQDSTPMILFVGQVSRRMKEREAFQELDYRQAFGQMAKWVAEIDDATRIPEFVSRAFHVASSGRLGPVVLALPEDMLTELVKVDDARTFRSTVTGPDAGIMQKVATLLGEAERPMILAGGSGWDQVAVDALAAFAQSHSVPVATTFRRQDRFDNRHACFAGDVGIGINPKLAARIKRSDLLLVIGSRLGEMATTGYTLLDIPCPAQRLIHVHADAEELGRVYQPTLAVHASAASFCRAIAALSVPNQRQWAGWAREANEEYLATLVPSTSPGPIQMAQIIRWLSDVLPDDAVICNGAGNFTTWVHRFYQYRQLGNQLAPNSGTMGYGLPAAIAAKLTYPTKSVVCIAGDGDFMMTSQELATAIQYQANIVVVVINNGMYGTIRMHQERHYPTRVIGTDLLNPDFVAMAAAFGAYSERVVHTAEFADAYARANASGRPALIELKVDPEALTPRQTLTEIRTAALAASL